MMDPDALELSRDALDRIRGLALSDFSLRLALRRWHEKQGSLPLDWQGKPFNDWLDGLIGHVARQIATWCDATRPVPDDNDVLCALRVNAIGDMLALGEEKTARKSFQTDINCYVEEGIVYSSIWLKGDDAKSVSDEADRIAAKMTSEGYSASTWIDEEDEHEVTVNAQIDFPLYRDMAEGAVFPECVLCPRRKCGKLPENTEQEGKDMPEKKSVAERAIQVVRENLFMKDGKDMPPSARFIEDLGADELDMIEMVMGLEEEFGFAIPENEAKDFATVGDVISYIEKKVGVFG